MKKESGMSIIMLVIITIIIMIAISVVINYAKEMWEETKVQDLRTNMLLIQAEAKKGLEEVCFRTVNLDEKKEEDLKKINEIKKEYLDGIILNEANQDVQNTVKNIPNITVDNSFYYLEEEDLIEMEINEVDKNQFGYFIVKYDFTNANVEVINTKGYNGNYTLTQINMDVDGE